MLAIGFLLLLVLLWKTDLRQVWFHLRQIPPVILMALATLQLMNRILVAVQWQRLAREKSLDASLFQMLHLNMWGTFFEGITPSVKFGGEAVKVWWMKRHLGWKTDEAATLLMTQKIISGSMFGLFFLFSFLAAGKWFDFQGISGLVEGSWKLTHIIPLGMVLLLVSLCAILIGKKNSGMMETMGNWITSVCGYVFSDMRRLAQRPGPLLMHGLLSGLIWGNYAVQTWVAATGMGIDAGFFKLAAVVFIAYAAGMIPLLPGGTGTFEGAMTLVLIQMGIEPHLSLALTLVVRTATFWLAFGISGIFLALFWLQTHLVKDSGLSKVLSSLLT